MGWRGGGGVGFVRAGPLFARRNDARPLLDENVKSSLDLIFAFSLTHSLGFGVRCG